MIKKLAEVVARVERRLKNRRAAVEEVAESFNMSVSSIYRLLAEGESFVYWQKDSPYPRLLRTTAKCDSI